MSIYGAAFELTFSREAAGAAISPNECRLYRSESVWAGSPLRTTLDRGLIPYPATGSAPNTRRVSGVATNTVPATLQFSGDMQSVGAWVNNAFQTNVSANLIQRCGYGYLIGRGRAAGGDYLYADDDLQTALNGAGAAVQARVDVFAGPGDQGILTGSGEPWETSNLNGGMWTSHLGIYDFVDDASLVRRQDELFLAIAGSGTGYRLPDGFTLNDCTYAAISPEGAIWLAPGDYGTTIPSAVNNNTANAFRNNPGVFLRSAGSSFLRGVVQRWRDQQTIIAEEVGQPLGIYTYSDAVIRSKWLIVVDGVASVVWLEHGDYRRPRDIWNNVIAGLINGTGSNTVRVTTVNGYGDPIGTETRWKYLEYARFLGEAGNTAQTNTSAPG